jgi:hypothetical protein
LQLSIREEAANGYLKWEWSKPFIRSIIQTTAPHQIVTKRKRIEQVTELFSVILSGNAFDFNEKIDLVKQSSKSKRHEFFRSYFWTKENYHLSDLGTVLPECGDLPLHIISQPFSEVIEYVKKRLEEHNWEQSVKYVADLMKIPDMLRKFPLIVIEPGSQQRSERKMEDYYGKGRRWKVDLCRGYIEDENHRAIAIVLKYDLESILCYVGRATIRR